MADLIKLCGNSFIRDYGSKAFITNQLTNKGLVFDTVGLAFLKTIKRQPVFIDDAIGQLLPQFIGVDQSTLKADYSEFVTDLERDGFVTTGHSEAALRLKEPTFSYASANKSSDHSPVSSLLMPENKSGLRAAQQQFKDLFRQEPVVFDFQINITTRCNEQCLHCYIPHKDKGYDIDPTLFRDALDELAEMGTVSVTISGGECMLHKEFPELLCYARQKDFSISILSNATLLTSELIIELQRANIRQLQTSLYSMSAKEHDAITMLPGSLDKTLTNIEKMVAANIPIEINCPVLQGNYRSVKDVLAWAQDRHIPAGPTLVIMGRSDCDTNNLSHRATIEQIGELLEGLNETGFLNSAVTDKSSAVYQENETCGVGWDKLCMGHDGNVCPCAGWERYCLGNIRKESIRSIWKDSEKLRALRKMTMQSFPQCNDCTAQDYCTVCLVRNANENNGDMFAQCKHVCKVAFLLRKHFAANPLSH